MNLNRVTPRHIVMKLSKDKDKERILRAKGNREKYNQDCGTFVRVVMDVSTETFQARREWDEIFKIL